VGEESKLRSRQLFISEHFGPFLSVFLALKNCIDESRGGGNLLIKKKEANFAISFSNLRAIMHTHT